RPFALNHRFAYRLRTVRKKNGKAISAQHFNFHPVLTSLFHFCSPICLKPSLRLPLAYSQEEKR
ncbi:hypothetical protein, partial [Salmonella enterica]|uniref:hypothetical protein n=1 Tax=Salmonella enterica TaxID=28901 RepID=UPI00262AC14D